LSDFYLEMFSMTVC